jgi:hypothetical protein
MSVRGRNALLRNDRAKEGGGRNRLFRFKRAFRGLDAELFLATVR